jgi:glucoamylase
LTGGWVDGMFTPFFDPVFESWVAGAKQTTIGGIFRCLSATRLKKSRPNLGQIVVPALGSVVASPIVDQAAGPDYFFHWIRDSAIAIDALGQATAEGYLTQSSHVDDFVGFSLTLAKLDGRDTVARQVEGRSQDQSLQRFMRSPEELASLFGERILGQARFNPDGTIDLFKWSNPQFDGPALRALAVLRALSETAARSLERHSAVALARIDLNFIDRARHEPCFDLWEERFGHHYYTRCVSLAALDLGAQSSQRLGDTRGSVRYRRAAAEIDRSLEMHWSRREGIYLAAVKGENAANFRDLDAAILLAVCHAGRSAGRHSALDPRVHSTLDHLERLFGRSFPINRDQAGRGLMLGRFEGDGYYGGGAYLMTTLAAAQIYYRLAGLVGTGSPLACTLENRPFLQRITGSGMSSLLGRTLPINERQRAALVTTFFGRGEAILRRLRDFLPSSAVLPEQLDRNTGAPASARDLAWSHAALLTALLARDQAKAAHPS